MGLLITTKPTWLNVAIRYVPFDIVEQWKFVWKEIEKNHWKTMKCDDKNIREKRGETFLKYFTRGIDHLVKAQIAQQKYLEKRR